MQNSDSAMYMNKNCCLDLNLQWNDSFFVLHYIQETL